MVSVTGSRTEFLIYNCSRTQTLKEKGGGSLRENMEAFGEDDELWKEPKEFNLFL